jgi:hypothetical protein
MRLPVFYSVGNRTSTRLAEFLWVTSRQVVYDAGCVILAWWLRGCRDGDHRMGLARSASALVIGSALM